MNDTQVNKTNRLISLDALRGFTIIGMIIVNTPGSWEYIFPPLKHASWHGLTPTDLVFPFFLYVVGVSIVLAYSKKLKSNFSKIKLLRKIIIRSLIIFSLGILLNLLGSNFEYLRLPGVLQRIALVFLICSILFLYGSIRGQIITAVIILIGYYLLMVFIPVPGEGAGVLLPGKNLAAWIDSKAIPFHMWQGTWDPEGILSTFPAVVTAIIGMISGHLMISDKKIEIKVIRLFVLGFVLTICGEMWGWIFPINKNIWTSSYVLYTAGLASLTWAFLIWLMDIRDKQKWAFPGIVFGRNAITAYVLSSLLLYPFTSIPVTEGKSVQVLYMESVISSGILPELGSFVWAILFTILCFIPVLVLYRKGIIIKV